MRFQKHRFGMAVGIGAVTILYVSLRMFRLTEACLFFDEVFSVHAAVHDWRDLFWFVARDLIHPPLFYVLLKIWIGLGGESLFWLRLFGAAWSVLAIIPFLLLCREFKLRSGEILTALLLTATNGALIRYGQEVRMYSVLFCLSLFSLWLCARFINRGTTQILIWLTTVNLLLIYTHYFGWIMVLSELTAVAVLKREKIKEFTAAAALLFLGFMPWMWAVWQASRINGDVAQNLNWADKPALLTLTRFFLTLSEPYYYQQVNIQPVNNLLVTLPLALLIFSALIYLTVAKWERLRQSINNRQLLIILPIVILTPLLTAFLVSWLTPFTIWGTRHLIIIFAPFAMLAAIAVWRLPLQILRTAALIVIGISLIIGGVQHHSRQPVELIWCGWENLANKIKGAENSIPAPTIIYAFEDAAAYHLWFTLKDDSRFKIAVIKNYSDMPEDKAYFLPRGFDEVQIVNGIDFAQNKFYLAYRAEPNKTLFKNVVRDLRERNFKIGAPLNFDVSNQRAVIIPVEKSE